MKNEKILLYPPRHCLSRPFWHKTPEKSAYRIMICTTQYENSRIFNPNCKNSNLNWDFYFWDRIVIPSHYSKLFFRKQVKFEMNRAWNSWNPTLCIGWGPIKKHVKTCHNKSRHVMFWKQRSRNVVFYMQIFKFIPL